MINNAYLNRVFADLQKNHPNEPEFLQAVDEVFESLQHVVDKHPEWEEAGLMEEVWELLLPSPPHAVNAKITTAASKNKSIFFKSISPFSAAVWGKARI